MDTPFPHIACCLDDSPAARGALAECLRLRALAPARLSLVHAVAPPPASAAFGFWSVDMGQIESDERAWLERQAAPIPDVEPVLLSGHPASAVCEWAKRAGVDLLVAASHRGILARATIGSFAGYLAHHAPCAVLLTRPPASAPAETTGAAATAHA
jgi:nucleotide-binding universal stress UspA family protein